MKTLLSAAVMAACLPAPSIAAPPPQQRPLVVTGSETSVNRWVDRVSRGISARLQTPALVSPAELDSGIAAVTFRCDGSGRPIAAALARRSGYPMLDRIALRTIRNMPSLGPLPANFAATQRFRANIIFAQSQAEYDGQVKMLRREAASARMASAGAPADTEIALSAGAVALPAAAD